MKMKRFLFPVIAMLLLFATSSCEKSFVGPAISTHYYTVQPTQWVTNPQVGYYYATFNDADITNNAIDNGMVMVYYLNKDGNACYDQPLPFIYYNVDGDVYWEEQFSYDLNPGQVTFKFSCSDFNLEESLAYVQPMEFKVVVIQNAEYRI